MTLSGRFDRDIDVDVESCGVVPLVPILVTRNLKQIVSATITTVQNSDYETSTQEQPCTLELMVKNTPSAARRNASIMPRLGSIWFRSEVERSGPILDSENGMILFFVWKREHNHFVFCLV
jgi:hypothetical protein